MLHSTTNSHKQMCGVQGIRYVLKKKRSTCGRRVEEIVLGEAGYAGLKICHRCCYCLELDAIRADEIQHVWQTKRLDRLDEILNQLVVVKSARQKQALKHSSTDGT